MSLIGNPSRIESHTEINYGCTLVSINLERTALAYKGQQEFEEERYQESAQKAF